ncbi:MAG: alpha/beta fold hydrolase [Anaerolineales bacterium]
MPNVDFAVNGQTRQGYLALPESGSGPGLLFLHAWWGLNDFFKSQCDRFAAAGFVVFAPDLHFGKIANTAAEAEQILAERDIEATQATSEAAVPYLQKLPAKTGDTLCAIGFSMGAMYALELNATFPDAFSKIVLVYGGAGADLASGKARFQAHFAETDHLEPIEEVRKMKAPDLELHIYPGTGHWFFESDRPEAYNAEAAQLAWSRALAFLKS